MKGAFAESRKKHTDAETEDPESSSGPGSEA
jgi:hypothetical protein